MKRDYLKHLGFQVALPDAFIMKSVDEPAKKWRRYRLKTKAVADYRPLMHDPRFPWWCSGHGVIGGFDYADSTIIVWLPYDEPVTKYWDDAFDVEFSEHEKIEFTDRFAKPEWFIES